MATPAVQNNNPGNLKDPATGKFKIFSNQQQGEQALEGDLQAKIKGVTRTNLTPNSSLYDFASVYAPSSDNNNPKKYAENLALQLGVSPTTPISALGNRIHDFAGAIAHNEDPSAPALKRPPVQPLASENISKNGDSLSEKVKAKYPQYSDIPDDQLTQKILAKYPQYKDMVPGSQEPILGPAGNTLIPGSNLASNLKRLPGDIMGAGNALLPAIGDIYNDVTGKSKKTALQQVGDVGSTALTAASLIPGLDIGALGLKGAIAEAPSIGVRLVRGGLIGGGYGASSSLGSGETDPTRIGVSAAEGAIGGAATEGILSKLLPGSTLNKSIQDTMPLENKATRVDALRASLPENANGGVQRKGILGTSTIAPSEEDVARGTATHPYINGVSDPVKQIQNVNKGIIDSSHQTDTFLDANAAPANFADMRSYVESNNIPDANLQKDPAAFENYQRATQSGLDTLAKIMTDSSKATGDFGPNVSGANIRKARIAIDQQISRELGETTFGTPQYKGIKAAEISLRNTFNRMSEDMLRYPGQLENLNKMNEFISSSRARGVEVDMNNPKVRVQLERQFGLNPSGETKAQQLAQQHLKMSHLYDARDNLIDRYQRKIGMNKVQETVQNSPVARTAVGLFKKAIPFGIADHI